MTDSQVYKFLAARRKFIAGLLAVAGILVAGHMVPGQVTLAVQAIVGFMGLYGIHEVANDPLDPPGAHAAP